MPKIVLVMLRQPGINDTRDDPFWEFGSFGCTGCHRTNILHPKKAREIEGARFAFVQGGPKEIRIVHLTPPVRVHYHNVLCEVTWTPPSMPFRYAKAPVLVSNAGLSAVPSIFHYLEGVNRRTWCGKFGSRFRARRTPLPCDVASEICNVIEQLAHSGDSSVFAMSYEQALPYVSKIDRSRKRTYEYLLKLAAR
jgi:hypothetical protein